MNTKNTNTAENQTSSDVQNKDAENMNPQESLNSRNWELELLISGAVFFSLFQLPSLIQSRIDDAIIQSSGVVMIVGWLYVKSISYMLIVNLGGHFLLRGYWVGLLGLASVFPQEIVWERLPYSALYQEYYRQKIRSLSQTATRVDAICRMVFGFTFMLLLLIVGACFLYSVAGLLGFGLGLIVPNISGMMLFCITFGVIFIPIMVIAITDFVLRKKYGAGDVVEVSPRFRGMLFALLDYALLLTLGRLYNSLMFTLRSNIATWKISVVLVVFVGGITLALLAEMLLRYDAHIFFAETDSRFSVEAAFYENFRQQEGNTIDHALFRFPSIQADVIRDPYVRLFLPYRVNDNDSLRRRMPAGFTGFHREGLYFDLERKENDSTRQLALTGLASIYAVSINDSVYSALDFHFHKHPQTGAPGLLTYIPSDGLKRGRNLLVIRRFGAKTEFFIPFYFVPNASPN